MDDATSASLLESGEVLPDMTDDDGGAEEKGGRCKFYTNLTRILESTKGSEGHTRPFDTFDIITI